MRCWICGAPGKREIGGKVWCDGCLGIISNLTVETLERIAEQVKKEVEEYHARKVDEMS